MNNQISHYAECFSHPEVYHDGRYQVQIVEDAHYMCISDLAAVFDNFRVTNTTIPVVGLTNSQLGIIGDLYNDTRIKSSSVEDQLRLMRIWFDRNMDGSIDCSECVVSCQTHKVILPTMINVYAEISLEPHIYPRLIYDDIKSNLGYCFLQTADLKTHYIAGAIVHLQDL